jgi:predicted nucleic acid-binding protein
MKRHIAGPRVYFDANVFIYALEAYAPFVSVLSDLSERLDAGELRAVTSELTLAETLVRPIALKDERLVAAYENALRSSAFLEVVPVGREILRHAAEIRAGNSQIRLPDAVHAATARSRDCATFLTNDARLKTVAGIETALLSDLAAHL